MQSVKLIVPLFSATIRKFSGLNQIRKIQLWDLAMDYRTRSLAETLFGCKCLIALILGIISSGHDIIWSDIYLYTFEFMAKFFQSLYVDFTTHAWNL